MTNKKRVIALGFFDGVHLGHGALLNRANEVANEKGGHAAALSFDIHPSNLVKTQPVPLICDAAARTDLMQRLYHIPEVIYVHFDAALMAMPWREFIAYVVKEYHAIHFVVGHDFRFGYHGEGTAELLLQLCCELGLGCDIIPKIIKDEIVISSTYIRSLLVSGDISRANEFLGHPHILIDSVRAGQQLGRTMGTPTVNMQIPPHVLCPQYGVYATRVYVNETSYNAVTNVGVRPTVSGENRISVESFLFSFHENLYGKQLRLEFYKFIRPEIRFPDLAALQQQIQDDIVVAKDFFSQNSFA